MSSNEAALIASSPAGWRVAPVEGGDSLLRLCAILAPDKDTPGGFGYVRVGETADALGVLGCFADQFLVPSRWVAIWLGRVPHAELGVPEASVLPTNAEIQRRWDLAWKAWDPRRSASGAVGWQPEVQRSDALLLSPEGAPPLPLTSGRERLPLRLCTEDSVLEANGLPTYSGSSSRFLIAQPTSGDPRFVWLSGGEGPADATVNVSELAAMTPGRVLFNAGPGLLGAFPLRVTPFHAVSLPELAAALHGEQLRSGLRAGPNTDVARADLEKRSSPLLARWSRSTVQRLQSPDTGRFFGTQDPLWLRNLEATYLRLQVVADLLDAVREAVDLTGLPLFNIAPESFAAEVESPRDGLPYLWQTRIRLVRPGVARDVRLCEDPLVRQFLRPATQDTNALTPTRSLPNYPADGLILDVSDSGPQRVVLKGQLTPFLPIEVSTTDLLQFYLPLGDRQVLVLARPTHDAAGRQAFTFRSLPFQPPAGRTIRAGAAIRVFVTTTPLEGTPHDLHAIFVLASRLLIAGGSPISYSAPDAAEEAEAIAMLGALLGGASTNKQDTPPPRLFQTAKDLHPSLYPAPLSARDGSPDAWPQGISLDLWSDVLRGLGQLRPGWPGCPCKDFSHFDFDDPGRIFDAPLSAFRALAARARTSLLGERTIDAEIREVALSLLNGS